MSGPRNAYMVAGSDALPYVGLAIESLLAKSVEPVRLTVLTDAAADRERYANLVAALGLDGKVRIFDKQACDERASEVFGRHPNVRAFRDGHPCWRKITDPSLFAEAGDEVIVLDPDIYFPNPFAFEPTRAGELLLMHQLRHCLLPADVVRRAFHKGIRLAHHTDIGVAHHTDLPWEWIDRLIVELGGTDLPRVPHVESIVWAAVGMEIGGGYLSPGKWACWERTALKRALLLLGMSGTQLLRFEPISRLKCFHASSGAKGWLRGAHDAGLLRGGGQDQRAPSPIDPYVEIGPEEFERGERLKVAYHRWLGKIGVRDPL